MKKALIGRKIGMSQYISEDGTMIPVTVCMLGPCVVVQKKTPEKDGYSSLKLGFEDVPERKLTNTRLFPVSFSEQLHRDPACIP